MDKHKARMFLCISLFSASIFSACLQKKESVPEVVAPPPHEAEEPIADGLIVDTKKELLTVRKAGQTVATFENLAFGSSGIGIKHKQGDSITPLGQFKIVSINRGSKFKTFLALDYPTAEYADRGLQEKVITKKQHDAIVSALENGKLPPQDTKLGGYIGIHGVGKGSVEIHRRINWTDGCIALDNEQIGKLVELVQPGMVVDVR